MQVDKEVDRRAGRQPGRQVGRVEDESTPGKAGSVTDR